MSNMPLFGPSAALQVLGTQVLLVLVVMKTNGVACSQRDIATV
jgi:hypothetical protein